MRPAFVLKRAPSVHSVPLTGLFTSCVRRCNKGVIIKFDYVGVDDLISQLPRALAQSQPVVV